MFVFSSLKSGVNHISSKLNSSSSSDGYATASELATHSLLQLVGGEMDLVRRSSWLRPQRLGLLVTLVLCLLASFTSSFNRKEELSRGGGVLNPVDVGSSSPSALSLSASSFSPIAPKQHLFSVEELFEQVAQQHWQPLEVLLQRGASRGALAKVAWQQQQKQAFAHATAVAKHAVESCEADEGTDACQSAKAEALASSSPAAQQSLKIGAFKAAGASDSTSSSSSSMVQVQGVLGSVWDNLFGGAGAKNAENFQGGNQGSYFNFMYPSDNDYPWACVCDESQYRQWLEKKVSYVACRNQVDLSTQNVVAMCNPENHTINAAPKGAWGSASAAAVVGALAAALALASASL
ncbi:hypothetical protein Esti_004546 [Eimeria stiedai]